MPSRSPYQVERGYPLADAVVDLLPFGARQDAWDDVERQYAVDSITFGIDRECNAEIAKLALRVLGMLAESGDIDRGQSLAYFGGVRGGMFQPSQASHSNRRRDADAVDSIPLAPAPT